MAAKKKSQSALHYTIVLIVFAVTGTSAAWISKLLMPLTGLSGSTVGYVIAYILLITPIYQVLLLGYAWLFGKFDYFWEKQKKLGRKIVALFRRRD
jgi:hypothetical protein